MDYRRVRVPSNRAKKIIFKKSRATQFSLSLDDEFLKTMSNRNPSIPFAPRPQPDIINEDRPTRGRTADGDKQ